MACPSASSTGKQHSPSCPVTPLWKHTTRPSSSPHVKHILQLQCLSPGPSPTSWPLPQCTLDQCAHSRWRAKKTVSPPAMTGLITPPLFSFSLQLSLFLSTHSLLPSLPGFGASNIDLALFLEQLWAYMRACTVCICTPDAHPRWVVGSLIVFGCITVRVSASVSGLLFPS